MKNSFTLIELLVVTSIIILLSAIILLNYRAGESQLALQRSAHKLARDIRGVQEMAMSAKGCPIEKCGGPPAIIPPRYGIECRTANPTYCILFADMNNNGLYQEGLDEEVDRITFERGVTIQQLFADDPPSSRFHVGITFKPPDPVTTIRGPADPDNGLPVTQIVLTNGTETKTITVNKAGLIYVE